MALLRALDVDKRATAAVTRVQIDLPADRVGALDQLAAEAGVATRKELLNNALTLLEWAVVQVKRGRVIASVDHREERMTELNMPVLSTLAERRGSEITG